MKICEQTLQERTSKGWMTQEFIQVQKEIKTLSKKYKKRFDTFNFKKKNDAIKIYKEKYQNNRKTA